MLGTLVMTYLFLGGFGAGLLCTAALWSLAFHRRRNRSREQTEAFERLKAACYVAGFVVLCLAALCLLLDLGRPDLFYLLFTRPTLSVLSFGSYTLLVSLLVGGFLAVTSAARVPAVRARARKAAEVVCVAASLCMMGYTGVFVACVEAVALWNNAAVPALFLLSSLSAGLSATFIVASFGRAGSLLGGWLAALHRAHLAVLCLEAVALAAFLALAFANPVAHESLRLLLDPEGFGGWLVVGVAALGLAAPLVVGAFMAVTRRALRLLPVDVLCIAGGLILRFCVVWSGMH